MGSMPPVCLSCGGNAKNAAKHSCKILHDLQAEREREATTARAKYCTTPKNVSRLTNFAMGSVSLVCLSCEENKKPPSNTRAKYCTTPKNVSWLTNFCNGFGIACLYLLRGKNEAKPCRAKYCTTYERGRREEENSRPCKKLYNPKNVSRLTNFCKGFGIACLYLLRGKKPPPNLAVHNIARSTSGADEKSETTAPAKYCTTPKNVSRLTNFAMGSVSLVCISCGGNVKNAVKHPCKILHDLQAEQTRKAKQQSVQNIVRPQKTLAG